MVAERLRAVLATATSTRARLAADPDVRPDLPELPPRPEPPIHLRVEVESLRRERARLEGATARMRREMVSPAAEDPGALQEALRIAESERGALEERLTAAQEALASQLAVSHAAAERARVARDQHVTANRAWRELAAEMERVRMEHEQQSRARAELEGRLVDAERVLREGHGAEPEDAIAELAQDDTVESLQRLAELLSRRLALVGKVNLLAAGELDSLRDRHGFMVRELEDVKSARRDLHEVIRDVDRQMAELFDDAFRDVSREFSALFASLFPGGEGRLYLTDPGDPLASGVEVEARPGRKRVKRLSLLSGGERSLTALAFLFAIFKARPSPFYLMDEVEAALDDVNLHRFLDVVRDLARTSQVLVVTHQKRTMEMADILYGVSMGNDGTSRVISQRLAVSVPEADTAEAGERRAPAPR
jgi:chromosome segregation protein